MTQTASYPRMSELLKPSPLHKFDVIAGGNVYKHSDIVTASVCCHEMGGKLYRIVPKPDAPRQFIRVAMEPLPADIAKVSSRRGPKQPVKLVPCVPMFGR